MGRKDAKYTTVEQGMAAFTEGGSSGRLQRGSDTYNRGLVEAAVVLLNSSKDVRLPLLESMNKGVTTEGGSWNLDVKPTSQNVSALVGIANLLVGTGHGGGNQHGTSPSKIGKAVPKVSAWKRLYDVACPIVRKDKSQVGPALEKVAAGKQAEKRSKNEKPDEGAKDENLSILMTLLHKARKVGTDESLIGTLESYIDARS